MREKNSSLKIWEKGVRSKGTLSISKLNQSFKISDEAEIYQSNQFTYIILYIPQNKTKTSEIIKAAKNAIQNKTNIKQPL